MRLPRIGITVDNDPDAPAQGPARYRLSRPYVDAVTDAGGLPLLLPHVAALAHEYVALCDGLILTGGDDPTTEDFGAATHPEAHPIDPERQAFELALLDAAAQPCNKPVLGICLGMQLMALHAGGQLDQYLPETLGERAASHYKHQTHTITLHADDSVLINGQSSDARDAHHPTHTGDKLHVVSHHRQAVIDPGALRTVARAPDGTIEAIDTPPDKRPFFLGVQWHPERGDEGAVNRGLIRRLVHAARATT